MMSQAQRRIIVPRLMDERNLNAQALNAKALLSRFRNPRARWFVPFYDDPHPATRTNPRIQLIRLLRRHLWSYHLVGHYLRPADAIFYANKEWMDEWGLRLRTLMGRRIPLILTLEGIVGDTGREHLLSNVAGHPVHCIHTSAKALKSTDQIYAKADHIIAISPFLGRVGRHLYGDKVSVLSLGVETSFFANSVSKVKARPIVAGAGTVLARKRVTSFVDLAIRFPEADFIWYGEGPDTASVRETAAARGATNFRLAGKRSPAELAEAFREADIFVHPSWIEGSPKVVQEAAACALPVVLFGFYEAPSVVHGMNGYVAWSDDDLTSHVGRLLGDETLRLGMGAESARMARSWTWDEWAPRWEAQILAIVDRHGKGRESHG